MTTRQRRRCRPVNGILLLDKPIGLTSNGALQKIKHLFEAKKAGHTGSLDPLASGMLPLCFGEATKFSQYLLEADKTYLVSAKLGIRTTTSDAEGEVVSERPVPDLTIKTLDKAFDAFRGEIEQVPSMYSALKHKGQPLYKLARQGITVEREARKLTIYELQVLDYQNETIDFKLRCSKGTYVRTIVDDLGEALGCGAHVTMLRRLDVGPYHYENMISVEQLEACAEKDGVQSLDQFLLPMDTSVNHWPELRVDSQIAFYLRQGQSVFIPQAPTSGWVRFALKDGAFIGVGEMMEDGKVAPRRLIKS